MKNYLNSLSDVSGLDLLTKSVTLSPSVVFSTSFGKEDQVITHAIASGNLSIDLFTLDTGRLFEETYAVFDRTVKKYNLVIKTYFPNAAEVEALITEKGPYSFYDSVENRKECCFIRKVEPLKRALNKAEIWVTGLRKSQSENRGSMEQVEWDVQNEVVKVHPLLFWSDEEVDAYLDTHNVPVNALHAQGFPSIGCRSCTRAVLEGELARAGRWWWESSHKECGLHQINKN